MKKTLILWAYHNSQNVSNEKNREVFRLSEKFKCFFFLFKNMAETNNLLLAYASEKIYLTSYLRVHNKVVR